MKSVDSQTTQASLTGWGVSSLLAFMLAIGAGLKLFGSPEVIKHMTSGLGYPAHVIFPLGVVEAVCIVLYLVPRTCVLGAVLLTGCFGGAVATDVRTEGDFLGGIAFGIATWVGVYLREQRLRALLPLRRPTSNSKSIANS